MSAIALVVAENGIVVGSDGAAYDVEDGTLQELRTKVLKYAHLKAVVACVGAGEFLQFLPEALGARARSFDDLLAALVPAMRSIDRDTIARTGRPASRSTVVAAGWSDAMEAWAAFKVSTTNRDRFNHATGETEVQDNRWTLVPVGSVYASPGPSATAVEECGIDFCGDPADLVVRIVCAARMDSGTEEPGVGYYGVGGFLELNILGDPGIRTSIVHRWPDQFGEMILPASGQLLPTFPVA